MKKRTIRSRFFGSLAIYTVVNYMLIGLALFSFDLYEYSRNEGMLGEEMEEVLVVISVMFILFPVSLLVAWGVSRWLLRPWRSMVDQAEQISGGRLEDRIAAENPSDEVGRLAATLNRTFDEYQGLLDRMQRFSYDASHQLRNPLAGIRTRTEICLKQPRSEEEYRGALEDVLGNTVRLSRTVTQLLLLARAAGGALDEYRESILLKEMIQGLVNEALMIGELREISVSFRVEGPHSSMRGVPDLIREALSNLIDNALKFTPDGGRIEVALLSLSGGDVRIEVSDSGPGLTGEQRAGIFRPFKRGVNSGREGTGLGLAIVADVCRAHQGSFGVDSSPLGGCRFWMEFDTQD
ncbi:MAG: HAMP domain-containing protein [Pontiellaceae bacterium]|nr:HAMP domain-containing protein [Pontiellaceae bacterium]MBN2785476.1 HAMP domain-containing protein [Pontiellaceae bacterium]